jgi:hypothetical protein
MSSLPESISRIQGKVRVQVHAKIEQRALVDAQAAGDLPGFTAMRAGRHIP